MFLIPTTVVEHIILRDIQQQNSSVTSNPNSVVGTNSNSLLYLWISFQLMNQTFMPILVATFLFSKSVVRHPTVINTCVTWVITGFISSLLFYARREKGPEPSQILCIVQASLLDGVLPMTAVAILALTYQVYLSIRRPESSNSQFMTCLLLVAPYSIFFIFTAAGAFLATQHPEQVSRSRRFFYCSAANHVSDAFSVFTTFIMFAAIVIAGIVCVYLHKNWRDFRIAATYDLQLLSRVGIFGVYVVVAFIMSIISISPIQSPFPDLFAASIGPVLAIILASQPDVYNAWLRRSKKPLPEFVENWRESQVTTDLEKGIGLVRNESIGLHIGDTSVPL